MHVNAFDSDKRQKDKQSCQNSGIKMVTTNKRKCSNQRKLLLYWLVLHISFILIAASTVFNKQANNLLQQELEEQQHIKNRQEAQAHTLCKIASNQTAKQDLTFFIYASSKGHQHIHDPIYKCLPAKPQIIFDLEDNHTEPLRYYATLSFYLLPAHWSPSKVLKKLQLKLNAQQRSKHKHYHAFLWQQQTLEQLLQLTWSKGLLNVLALNGSYAAQLYTYEPYTPLGFQVRSCKNLNNLYHDKLKNLHQAPLRISMFEDMVRAKPRPNPQQNGFDGVDGLVARTISQLLNATPQYVLPAQNAENDAYGDCYKNGSCTGTLADLVSQRSDVAFNTRLIFKELVNVVEQLYPFYFRNLVLTVPGGDKLPESLVFQRAFSESLWLLLCFNILVVCLAFYLLQLIAVRWIGCVSVAQRLSFWSIVDMIFKLQFGEPLPTLGRISSLRLFVISWIFCSYVVTNVYFAQLKSSFMHNAFEPDINYLSQFSAHFNNSPVFVGRGMLKKSKMFFSDDFPWHTIYSNLKSGNYTGYPDNISLSNAAFIFRREVARDFLARTYNNLTHRPSYHAIIKEPIVTIPRSYILPLGSPFLYKFDALVTKLFEHGILSHWLSLYVEVRQYDSWEAEQYYKALSSNLEGVKTSCRKFITIAEHRVALNVDILQVAFYLWIFGVILSFLVFLYELARKKKCCCFGKC